MYVCVCVCVSVFHYYLLSDTSNYTFIQFIEQIQTRMELDSIIYTLKKMTPELWKLIQETKSF